MPQVITSAGLHNLLNPVRFPVGRHAPGGEGVTSDRESHYGQKPFNKPLKTNSGPVPG